MLFSVIIPTYNRRDLLIRTLASVWVQRFTDFEVIVVDDGSTDGTADALRSQSGRLTLLEQANRGPGAARNVGAQRARGDYLAFLDSDDLWFPWTLATFAQVIRDHDAPAVLAARLVEIGTGADPVDARDEAVQAERFADYLAASRTGYAVGAGTAVLRRDEFMKTGGFTDRRINCEDHDLILRMGTACGFAQVIRPVTLGWRRHRDGATMDLARSVAGNRYLIEQERRGAYPGGPARAAERRRIVTLHSRPASLSGLQDGLRAESWWLYRKSFVWHVQLGRWKYLVWFPVKALLG
jgi:glycosyltransferase involved in cell wall biosynthesis